MSEHLKPFVQGQGTPLSVPPYDSRKTEQEFIDLPKNYVLLGFRPGYALQASELNEIQENFYLQQTLTTTMISNWGSNGDFGPGWGRGDAFVEANDSTTPNQNGLTPISPNMITINTSGDTITFKKGWYLAQLPKFDENALFGDREMNFKIWINSPTDLSANVTGFAGAEGTYLGFDIKQEFVTEAEDSGLNDPSGGGSPTNTIPGATRYKASVVKIVQDFNGGLITNSVPKENSGEKTPFAVKVSSSGNFVYLNNYPITVV